MFRRSWEPVAQLVEQLTFNQRVTGSNPVGLTIVFFIISLYLASPVSGRSALSVVDSLSGIEQKENK